MKAGIVVYTIIYLLIFSIAPVSAAKLDQYKPGLYIADYENICYAVTIKEIPSKSTLRFRRMGMIEVPCSGTGSLPRISGTWRTGIETNTGTCYLEFEIAQIARGSHKQILMAQVNKDCS